MNESLRNNAIRQLEKQLTPHEALGYLIDIYVGMLMQAKTMKLRVPEQAPENGKIFRQALRTLSKDIASYKEHLGI